MSDTRWWVLATAAVLLFWCVGGYNRLMALRNRIGEAFVQLADALQMRSDAVAPLAQALQERLPGELASLEVLRATLGHHEQALAAARQQATSAEAMSRLLAAEGELAAALLRVQALLDRRGDLAAEPGVQHRLAQLHHADGRITFARQLFNEAVLTYNDAREQFPTRLLAHLFRLQPASAL